MSNALDLMTELDLVGGGSNLSFSAGFAMVVDDGFFLPILNEILLFHHDDIFGYCPHYCKIVVNK